MKETALYLEVDEDITSAIDKLTKIDGVSVQVVAPKRSTMLQSIINLKLLKKAAGDAGKELVLVTNDRVTGDLAGRVGLAVAPSIGAKPVLAELAAPKPPSNDDIIEGDEAEPPPPMPAAAIPLAAAAVKSPPMFARKDIEDQPQAAPVAAAPAASEAPKPSGLPKVPNFNLFKRRMLWVGLAVALIAGYVLFMALFTTASVTLYATGTKVAIDTSFVVDSNSPTDLAAGVISGQAVSNTKTLSGSFTPTGQQDAGAKATGAVSIQNCEDTNVYPLAAGDALVSQGLTFTTNQAVTIPAGTFNKHGANCTSPTVSVPVTAAANGDQYNLTNASFSSAKLTSNFIMTSAQLTGGISKIETVVTQANVDTASAAVLATDKTSAEANLKTKVPTGYMAMPNSLQATPATATPSPAVGAVSTSATFTMAVTYSLMTIKQSDYTAFIDAQEQTQIGSNNQIYNDGQNVAQLSSGTNDSSGRPTYKFATQAFDGVKLDSAGIIGQLKGKRYGDAVDIAGKQPGVQHADVVISPAWATSLPGNAAKIKLTIKVATQG
jgi:hypothetical protein